MNPNAWHQLAREKRLPTSVVGGVPLDPKAVSRKRAA